MLLRIRSPSGTHRVEVADTATVDDLKRKIFEAISVPEDEQFLSTNPSGTAMIDGPQKLSAASVKHGDMIYLITEAPAKQAGAAPSSSQTATKCTHGPNAKCVYCTTTTDSQPAAKKCNHGSHEMCLNCQPVTKKTSKKIDWLCTHPPGGKCVNCMRVPKKVASKCNHPSNMFCPNCTGDKGKDKKEEAKKPLGKCNHGPNGACANCRPFVPEDEAKPSYRCRNHGPHGSCIECIEREDRLKMRLKLQDTAHCTSAVIDYQAASMFQNYLHEQKFQAQRVGLLYGKFMEDGSTVIDVIYEPPQKSTKTEAVMLPDPDKDRVESIASMLGLRKVGWIFSHPHRNYVMSSAEVTRTAELQNEAGPGFVTLILSFNEKNVGNLEAFQLSDQALKLQREGMFMESPKPDKIQLRQPVIVEGAEATLVDYHFFLVTVSIKPKEKSFLKTEFHIENRQPPQAKSDLKVHMMHSAKRPFIDQLSDFHLLLFLSKGYFDLNTDMPALCEAVRTRKADHLEGFKILMESFAS